MISVRWCCIHRLSSHVLLGNLPRPPDRSAAPPQRCQLHHPSGIMLSAGTPSGRGSAPAWSPRSGVIRATMWAKRLGSPRGAVECRGVSAAGDVLDCVDTRARQPGRSHSATGTYPPQRGSTCRECVITTATNGAAPACSIGSISFCPSIGPLAGVSNMRSKLLQKIQSREVINGQQGNIEDSSMPWRERENPSGQVRPATGRPGLQGTLRVS
jgi:hypothetical protein